MAKRVPLPAPSSSALNDAPQEVVSGVAAFKPHFPQPTKSTSTTNSFSNSAFAMDIASNNMPCAVGRPAATISQTTLSTTLDGESKIKEDDSSNFDAAEEAVARLGSIMNGARRAQADEDEESVSSSTRDDHNALKRKASFDPESAASSDNVMDSGKKKKMLSNERREERNLREKERSLKITQQIQELRNLLSQGGVIVPKGTKSTILTEAANYIRLLQQHQQRSETDRAQLVHEVQRIGNGAIGQKAAVAIRHVAAQNGVYSMANFGDGAMVGLGSLGAQENTSDEISDNLNEREYRCVFNSCSVGMAIASMGGSFIDCNTAFTQLSSYTKQELKAMTIFNITSREDLQGAFDMMSQLITPTGLDADGNTVDEGKGQSPVILRSAIRHRNDLGLSVSLIRGDDGVARYFNVTLVKLPPQPMAMGTFKPIPATADMPADIPQQQNMQQRMPALSQTASANQQPPGMNKQFFPGMHTPQYTAG